MMKHKRVGENESGIVSIIVTLILMVVVTLIIIGFSRVAQREQRQALDRQLSTQATYAAESGINDAISTLPDRPDNCGPTVNVGDVANKVQYTCVLVDLKPDSLQYSDVGVDNGTLARFTAEDPTTGNPIAIDRIEITWQGKDADTTTTYAAAGYNKFKKLADWTAAPNNTGVLRTTLTGIDIPGWPGPKYTRDLLNLYTQTSFLYPNKSASNSHTMKPGEYAESGTIVGGNCTVTPPSGYKHCTSDIVLDPAPNEVFMQLKSIYSPSTVTVRAYNSGVAQPLDIVGAQALIDSTGKANDVIRRLQVRVPLKNKYTYPNVAVQATEGLCKLLNTAPVGGSSPGNSIDGVAAFLGYSSLCAIN